MMIVSDSHVGCGTAAIDRRGWCKSSILCAALLRYTFVLTSAAKIFILMVNEAYF